MEFKVLVKLAEYSLSNKCASRPTGVLNQFLHEFMLRIKARSRFIFVMIENTFHVWDHECLKSRRDIMVVENYGGVFPVFEDVGKVEFVESYQKLFVDFISI